MRLFALSLVSLLLVGCHSPQDENVVEGCVPASSPPVSMNINDKDVVVSKAEVVGESILPPEEDIDKVVGWYDASAMPDGCDDGSIVITSHINNKGVDGVGMDFVDLDVGDELSLTTSDAKEHGYVVVESMELVDKDSPDFMERGMQTFNKVDGEEILVLITCAGEFDPTSPLGYQSNGIIVAEPE